MAKNKQKILLLILVPIISIIGAFLFARGYYYSHNLENLDLKPTFVDDGKVVLTTKSEIFYFYTGEEIKPIQDLGNGLEEGKDYEIEYTDNINCGEVTATIKGINKYTGSCVCNFDIVPRFTNIKGKLDGENFNLTWDECKEATGYVLYFMENPDLLGEPVSDKILTKTKYKYKIKNGQSSTVFYVLPVAENSEKYLEKFGPLMVDSISPNKDRMAIYEPELKPIKSVSFNKKSNGYEISWAKQLAAQGYKIYKSKTKKLDENNVKEVSLNTNSVLVENQYKYFAIVPFMEKRNFVDNEWTAFEKVEIEKPKIFSTSFDKTYVSYYTYYVNNPNRTTNLKLASKAISGTILNPGDTFSFNEVVGQRTVEKGYKSAHIFLGPNEMVEGTGGGVCQVASTIFNAALLGDFKIVARNQHSQRVTYVALGRDAAIAWPATDFKFQNNKSFPIKILMDCSGGKLTVKFIVPEGTFKKPKVNIWVNQNGKNFTTHRSVNGEIDYTCYSYY